MWFYIGGTAIIMGIVAIVMLGIWITTTPRDQPEGDDYGGNHEHH